MFYRYSKIRFVRKKGVALLYAIILIGVILMMVLLMNNIAIRTIIIGRAEYQGMQAYYAADAADACRRYMRRYYLNSDAGSTVYDYMEKEDITNATQMYCFVPKSEFDDSSIAQTSLKTYHNDMFSKQYVFVLSPYADIKENQTTEQANIPCAAIHYLNAEDSVNLIGTSICAGFTRGVDGIKKDGVRPAVKVLSHRKEN